MSPLMPFPFCFCLKLDEDAKAQNCKHCPNCRKDIRKWSLQRSEQIDYAVAMVAESIKLKQGAQAEGYVRY